MKLYLLRPVEDLKEGDNPWDPWYDKTFGLVVRAETEEKARALAQEDTKYEHYTSFMNKQTSKTNTPWTDSNYSICMELTTEGPETIIIKDEKYA